MGVPQRIAVVDAGGGPEGYALAHKAIADLGLRALAGIDIDDLLQDACRVTARVLGVELVGILQAVPEGWFFRAGVGWNEGLVGSKIPALARSSVRFIMESSEPVIMDDVQGDPRFDKSPVLEAHGSRSGIGVVIMKHDGPFGVVGVHSIYDRRFTGDEVSLVQTIANVVGVALERKDSEAAMRQAFEREREAAERLRSLDEMKNAFLEAVSHELRTPLASVLGYALTLKRLRETLDAGDEEILIDRLCANAEKLKHLLNDLLDLDRLNRRTIHPQRQRTDLLELVMNVVSECQTEGRRLHIANETVVVDVDAPKVERIVENLIANSIKHAPEAQNIWIKLRRADAGALIVVEDDGPGIPDAMKQAVFQTFRRGSSAPSHSPGSGIGLSLVMRFAELHGGRAWVEDRDGGGAAFHVLLPGSAASRGSVEPRDASV